MGQKPSKGQILPVGDVLATDAERYNPQSPVAASSAAAAAAPDPAAPSFEQHELAARSDTAAEQRVLNVSPSNKRSASKAQLSSNNADAGTGAGDSTSNSNRPSRTPNREAAAASRGRQASQSRLPAVQQLPVAAAPQRARADSHSGSGAHGSTPRGSSAAAAASTPPVAATESWDMDVDSDDEATISGRARKTVSKEVLASRLKRQQIADSRAQQQQQQQQQQKATRGYASFSSDSSSSDNGSNGAVARRRRARHSNSGSSSGRQHSGAAAAPGDGGVVLDKLGRRLGKRPRPSATSSNSSAAAATTAAAASALAEQHRVRTSSVQLSPMAVQRLRKSSTSGESPAQTEHTAVSAAISATAGSSITAAATGLVTSGYHSFSSEDECERAAAEWGSSSNARALPAHSRTGAAARAHKSSADRTTAGYVSFESSTDDDDVSADVAAGDAPQAAGSAVQLQQQQQPVSAKARALAAAAASALDSDTEDESDDGNNSDDMDTGDNKGPAGAVWDW
jgi:hypothetical protein